MRIHFAAEHSPKLELAEFMLDGTEFFDDIGKRLFIFIVSSERMQLACVADTARESIQRADKSLERRALPAEALRAVLILPNRWVL
jgi:hypothetical protein